MTDKDHLQYRPCVGTMLVNGEGRVFVGKRIDNKEGDWWQMPQGGVDPGEDMDVAMLREVGEETGLTPDLLQIVDRMPEELYYDLPEDLQGKLWGGKYRGQRQTWYLVRFTGSDGDIDLNADKHPEFSDWKWVDAALLPELIVPFKKPIYEAVVAAFAGHLRAL
ncbi:RNA pyrophosphohydrolase [Erythrobacter arachoides]|uniref:RNA pyrophosphohydrolase n=1 Tax=Aurantiacibacter arachoides TaxID=1850444 RepID=A0A845A1S3_9SPHN|nr:RNA pyrophosphohydrolase [Aurantiacibacter arachoides]MXO93402.1 RNA pyrophosphohydrolase [Aurantiacibacter arachoides]GGD49649.1 RNA pyrophosphohydrolase [Aurantiacibacter arachoides]